MRAEIYKAYTLKTTKLNLNSITGEVLYKCYLHIRHEESREIGAPDW